MLIASLALALLQDDPVEFGRADAVSAVQSELSMSLPISIELQPELGAEAFHWSARDGRISISGGDVRGCMYGALDLGECVRLGVDVAPPEQFDRAGHPYLAVRAINPFLTLPWNEDKNEPDYDLAALTDPKRWYFQNDDYWKTLFDEMARARLNTLDLHGTCDIHTTRFPNFYAYFVDSASFPEVGVPKEIKQKNLAQLNRVIDMAHRRGVKFTIMSYEASFYTPHREKVPYDSSEENLAKYTREVVEALIRGAPGLDALGFRIGESGHGANFFQCYIDAVKASDRDIPLYTRSWITRKSQVVPLARASNDFTVEIKYNGEQWGPPYIVAGGRVPGWGSYSFEDYLSDSGDAPALKMWPGNWGDHKAAPDRWSDKKERWPSQPYKIVWQVRANGTHRIFPFYEPSWVRRSITSMKLGTATGFSVELLNSFFPPSPRYYTADPKDIAFRWIHQRDEPYLMLWGRLGYDPNTPDEVLDAFACKHIGGDARLLGKWKAASRVIPTAFTAFSLGPDHRNHAPELEWGGDTYTFLSTAPFDSHAFKSTQEWQAYFAVNGRDGRLMPREAARLIGNAIGDIPLATSEYLSAPSGSPGREIEAAVALLRQLAWYYEERLSGAAWAADEDDSLGQAVARSCLNMSASAWQELSESFASRFYKPFPDRLRMGSDRFTWASELPKITADIEKFVGDREVGFASDGPGWRLTGKPKLPLLRVSAGAQEIAARLDTKNVERAWVLYKPLPSSTYFHKLAMQQVGDDFEARIPRANCGQLIAAEVQARNEVFRIPEWTKETPYLVVPSRTGTTPLYYSSEEALAYLDPKSLDPSKQGLLFVAPRAGDFFWRFDARDKHKLLDGVERGMTLLVMNQDFASGRYKFDWLPQPPKIEAQASNVFDPAGAFGLEKVETADILWQPIRASAGWEVFGNGGIAQQKIGNGRIVLVQARLQQRMHIPAAARDIKALLELNGRDKPLVIIDAGSENATFATSVFPDFCNALDIPFLTLGEVIANEQGLVTQKIAGPVQLDDALGGKGKEMLREYQVAKVREKAERPVPATRELFEERRKLDRVELMKSLGLDPLPQRSPLNARITNTLKRSGYRVEMLTFESRPGVIVTANVYVPEPLPTAKVPVILNPNGHWPHKKSATPVQSTALGQVLRGYIAITIDSPGFSFEGDTPIERRELGTHDDLRLVAASMNATSIYVWDLMRALDYAATRKDSDMSRVGITGASGGGLATLYAFAADERITCAVPVCYPVSMAVQPDNGCLCNHVPGTLQIGDRADLLGLRAPAPVLLIGATGDREFPPQGTVHSSEKLAKLWSLFGAQTKVGHVLVESGHDYNQPMREAAVGFFDRWLRGVGDGSPVPEPALQPEPEDSKELVAAREGQHSTTTMRQLAIDALSPPFRPTATWEQVVAINGGKPARAPFDLKVLVEGAGDRPSIVTFTSEPGLSIPALIYEPAGARKASLVLVSDQGKLAAVREFDVPALVAAGYACCCIDARGCGELSELDLRLTTYLGTSPAYSMGWDAACAAEEMLRRDKVDVVVIGRGACASQAACYARLFDETGVAGAIGLEGIRKQIDAMQDDVALTAVQPRALYGGLVVPHPADLAGPTARNHLRGEHVDLVNEIEAVRATER